MEKPFDNPLILIWGPAEGSDHEIEGKNLFIKRDEIREAISQHFQDRGVKVHFSEDEELRDFTKQLETFGKGDIAKPEKQQVEWACIVIGLDYPHVKLTLHTEMMYLLDRVSRAPKPQYLKKIYVFEPETFLDREKATETISPTGSFALDSLVEKQKRLKNVLKVLPYSYAQFGQCLLRKVIIEEIDSIMQEQVICDEDIIL